MRYLYAILLLFISLQSQAQKTESRWHRFNERQREMMKRHREMKEEREDSDKPRPYADFIINGGVLYPMHKSIKPNNGGIGELGLDVMFNRFQRHLFLSVGTRIGLAGFSAYNGTDRYSATGAHGGFLFGINYMNNPKGKVSLYTSLHVTGGLRAQSNGPMGNPYATIESSIGIYLMHTITFNLNGSFTTPMEAYRGEYSTTRNASESYNVFALTAGFRINLKRNEDE